MTYSKWELARYLIDAKKCVDSVMFIARHKKSLENIGIAKIIRDIQQEFYIKCCVVIDKALPSKERGHLKNDNPLIDSIYYERDKDKAHKDRDYKKKKFGTLVELSERMKKQIFEVRRTCSTQLPQVLTLDFVPHDRVLFRMVYSLTPEKEEEICKRKYPHYHQETYPEMKGDGVFQVLEDTEDLYDVPQEEIEQFGVVMKDGINEYEGLQNRQDSCILINVLWGGDMWVRMNEGVNSTFLVLKKCGFLDEFDVLQLPEKDETERINLLNQILNQAISGKVKRSGNT